MGLFGLKYSTFSHGVHPPQNKEETKHLPIRQFPFAPYLVLPISQHLGAPPDVIVKVGEEILRGQKLAIANKESSVALHAPVSGSVSKIGLAPAHNGKMTQAIFLKTAPYDTQEVIEGKPIYPLEATPNQILTAIQQAGIVGLGGAAFPTHLKLKIQEGKSCKFLIINGVECEPFLTTDHRVMLEQPEDIFMGIRYLLKVTHAEHVIIGIEENKKDAALLLSSLIPSDLKVHIQLLKVKYPQGAEKMLITAITGKEVPSGKLPIEIGCVVINVATTAEIGRLLPKGRGIQERVITISGSGIIQKGNYLIPIGTPLRFILDYVGVKDNANEVFLGGPMMGMSVSNLDIPIVKGTSGVIAFDSKLTNQTTHELPCIRCGACIQACPLSLEPVSLVKYAKQQEYEYMQNKYHLFDCFECGSCSYVCPSHIPLVQYFRQSKMILKKRIATNAA